MTATTWRELPAEHRRHIVDEAIEAGEQPREPQVAELARAWAVRQLSGGRTLAYLLVVVIAVVAAFGISLAVRNLVAAGVIGVVCGGVAAYAVWDGLHKRKAATVLLGR